jgi:uncharacterized membrane protein YgcG
MEIHKNIIKLKTMKKYKYFLYSTFFIVFLFYGATFVSAVEVTLPGLGDSPTLGQYAAYLFNWIIGLAASLAVISFVVGAIGYLISADSAEAKSNGKDRMKGAILGLVLTFASFLIIDLINPNLENFTSTPLTQVAIPAPTPEAGVYFFSEDGCAGDNSGVVLGSQDNLEGILDLGIKSLKIVDDTTNNINYGVILHREVGLDNGGECSQPITTAGCQSIGIDAGAADIFQINTGAGSSATGLGGGTTSSSGNGVTFFSEPYGQTSGARAGFYPVTPEEITAPYSQQDPNTMCFSYTNITRPDAYKYKCNGSCGGSNNGGGDSNNNIPSSFVPGGASASLANIEMADTNNNIFLLAQISGTSCSTNADCTANSHCEAGKCVLGLPATSCNIAGGNSGCAADSHCSTVSGKCVLNSTMDTGTTPANGNSGNSSGTGSGSANNGGVSCSDSACETFQDCHGSIKIRGNYLVAIYSQNGGSDSSGSGDSGSLYCQTFTTDADNLKTEPIIASGGYTLSSIYIIPTK